MSVYKEAYQAIGIISKESTPLAGPMTIKGDEVWGAMLTLADMYGDKKTRTETKLPTGKWLITIDFKVTDEWHTFKTATYKMIFCGTSKSGRVQLQKL